jgi:hypothetical protein
MKHDYQISNGLLEIKPRRPRVEPIPRANVQNSSTQHAAQGLMSPPKWRLRPNSLRTLSPCASLRRNYRPLFSDSVNTVNFGKQYLSSRPAVIRA